MTNYIVIETNHKGMVGEIYKRFHQKGRIMPEGLFYIDSWLEKTGRRCFCEIGPKPVKSE